MRIAQKSINAFSRWQSRGELVSSSASPSGAVRYFRTCNAAANRRQAITALSATSSSFLSPTVPTSIPSGREGYAQTRTLATAPPGLKAYPQYTVFGETCLMTVKVIMPGFRVLKSNTLVVDGSKRGRIALEWTPRDSEGRPVRDSQIRFALSPEECGLMLDQLPKKEDVQFIRRMQQYSNDHPQEGGPSPDKVLHITPGQGGMISFKVDFEKDGVGGHETRGNFPGAALSGPLEVIVQTGEYQVIHALIQNSIPHLVGWTTMMELALSRAISDSLQHGSEGGQRFSTSDSNDGSVPF